jgi:predicted branched-subunit amino acid permease
VSAVPADWSSTRSTVLRTSLGVGVATGAYGVSFGALATTGGFSVVQACALSALVFTGGSQFAFIGVIASGGSATSASATALLLGSRNLLYGVRLATLLGLRGPERAIGAHLVIDESTAVALGQDEQRASKLGFWATGLAVFVLWNLATLIGALAGQALGDPATYGLDAAVPAAFLALLVPRLRDRLSWSVAAAAGAVALMMVPFVPAGVPVLVAALVAVLAGAPGRAAAARPVDAQREGTP